LTWSTLTMPLRKVVRILGPAVTAALVLLGCLFFIAVIIVFAVEHGRNPRFDHFRSAMYWVLVTVVDGAPWSVQTGLGKTTEILVGILQPVSIAVITAAVTSQLYQLVMARSSGRGRSRLKNHIVICGWSSKGTEIIREIRGRGDESSGRRVVILAALQASPSKDELTTFIAGDPTLTHDLERAGIEQADVAIVLADNSYPGIDAEEMDSRTLITVLAIESLNPGCYTCVEVIHSVNREHFNRTRADELVVSAHLTGALLAHSAMARGLSRIVDDLLTYPAGDEFYWVEVPAGWIGTTFQVALGRLKQGFDCLPLAVSNDGNYVTNPKSDYILAKGDRLLVLSKQEPVIN
jgi:voltage-gated potassium channel